MEFAPVDGPERRNEVGAGEHDRHRERDRREREGTIRGYFKRPAARLTTVHSPAAGSHWSTIAAG